MWAMDKVYSLQSDKGKSFHKMVLGQLYAQIEKSISHHYPKSVSNGSWSLNKNSNKTICRIDYTKISFWTIVICNKMCMFHKQNGERVYPIITLLLICFVIIPLGMWLRNSLSQMLWTLPSQSGCVLCIISTSSCNLGDLFANY